MLKMFIASCFFGLTACSNYAQLHTVTKLPKSLKENSGMVMLNENHIWVIEDSGNKDEIYEVNLEGKITRTLAIKDVKNHDWEELTKDDQNNVYIGDFGNNDNDRKNLSIYIIPNPVEVSKKHVEAKRITFSYPEQKEFPYHEEKRIYDCEAFFYLNNSLYLFTKDRSKPYTGTCLLYKIPAKPGDYKAELLGSFHFGDTFDTGSITAATISKDHQKVVLLTHKMLYLLENFEEDDFFSGKLSSINMEHISQKEAVSFKDKNTLLISDEAEKHGRAHLYEIQLSE